MENNNETIYVVYMKNKVAMRVTSNNGKYLTPLGSNSVTSYFTIPSSEISNLLSELHEEEEFKAESAAKAKSILPAELWPELERIANVKVA